ncbi:MAG: AAA family ATPase [Methanomassiliicoccales archaeon]|nr:AAA family ATPase [Methanomassiliicoccales archaeon]
MTDEISFKRCRNSCPDIAFKCESTADLKPLEEIIGQDRALKALEFGLNIGDKGFNIFASGYPGTGRRTAIVDYVKELAKKIPIPPDWCYVNNFRDPTSPHVLKLPSGRGEGFKKDMEKFVAEAIRALRKAFESEEYAQKASGKLKSLEDERKEHVNKLSKMTMDAGFQLQQSQIGLLLIPVVNGQPITDEQFASLPPQTQDKIQKKREGLEGKVRAAFRNLRELETKAQEEVKKLSQEIAAFAMEPLLEAIRESYSDCKDVIQFVADVEKDILDKLPMILQRQQEERTNVPFNLQPPAEDPTQNYKVNAIVDNSKLEGAPVEIEMNPSYYRLFGAIEKEARFGALTTNYTMVRGGAMHRANGGFLVLPIERLFTDPFMWESLKHTISTEKLEIEEPGAALAYILTKSLRPEPIPFKAKIILLGTPLIYETLYALDPDFKDLFKVKADFDTSMERNEKNIKQYASFVCSLCEKEKLMHLDPSGLAAVVEYSSRLAQDQGKLSTRFSEIADIIREANFYAKQDNSKLIKRKHINQQLEERVYRSNMIQKKIEEMVQRNLILIETEGEKVGQVNGLAVMGMGDYAFGKPSRITASIAVGKEGIIDIERQAQMGGPTHTKGVLILSGYLNDRYAQDHPLGLTARLVFEQSYSGVDGDSASSTELYALLSALSGRSIRQYLAVTGSVNQKGEVQAIGGVNEKIEGFFDVCKSKGLTGNQGCVIPESNVQNLMLREDVVDAIRQGRFHIYPVKTINDGIEALTGFKAGERKKDGTYDKGTINDLVQKRLAEMAEKVKAFKE